MKASSKDLSARNTHQGVAVVEHLVADGANHSTRWICEKWEQDKVDYAHDVLEKRGVFFIQDGWDVRPAPFRDKIASVIAGRDVSKALIVPKMIPIHHGITSEMLRQIVGDPDEIEVIEGNLLLNEGIAQLWDLAIAALNNQTAGNPYSNGNSFIGVGDSSTAEAATQTDLSAATNHFYKGMNATYPSRASQTVSWQSDFTTSEANYAWAEWSITAGATTASGAGFTTGTKNLNRKVQSLGTKASGTWTLTAQVTLS